MSKTKLPRECTITRRRSSIALHPVRVAAGHQGGACGDQPAADPALDRLGHVGVLRAPMGEHDDDVDPRGQPRTSPRTWRRSARFSGPVRGGIRTDSAPGRSGAARGVSPIALKPMKPKRTPPRTRTTGRLAAARSRPAPNARMPLPWNARVVSSSARLRSRRCGCWRARSRRNRRRRAREDRRGRGERVGTLARSSRLRQRALEVSDREICRGQPARHRPQRSGGVAGARVSRPDPAAQHDVADDLERRDRGRRRPGHPQRILGRATQRVDAGHHDRAHRGADLGRREYGDDARVPGQRSGRGLGRPGHDSQRGRRTVQ